MAKIYVVGMGPGGEEYMTQEAAAALEASDVIAGYKVYIDLIKGRYAPLGKELLFTEMKEEEKRCELCLERALSGKTVSLICSGDAGVYGMASLMIAIAKEHPEVDIEVVAGVTAALSGSAVLGAPIGHDFCVISLSDLMTPWELIKTRLIYAAKGDFVTVIYNPSSKGRPAHFKNACDILAEYIEPSRVCGLVHNIGRDGESHEICSFAELKNKDTDMFTTVFIGNMQSEVIGGRFVTPRGYKSEER